MSVSLADMLEFVTTNGRFVSVWSSENISNVKDNTCLSVLIDRRRCGCIQCIELLRKGYD